MQYPLAGGSSPNILESSPPNNISSQTDQPEEVQRTPSGGDNKKHWPVLSRSAMVKAVVANSDKTEEKPVKSVCLVDKPQIFPAGSAMTTRAVIETSSSGSSAEYPTPSHHPKGINRLNCKKTYRIDANRPSSDYS